MKLKHLITALQKDKAEHHDADVEFIICTKREGDRGASARRREGVEALQRRRPMRESKIERYLHEQVEKHGGTTRKFVSPGRRNVPDRIVIWPYHLALGIGPLVGASIHFVECKAPGKTPRKGQYREHTRLRDLGCIVLVLDTIELIDDYVRSNS